MNLDGFVRAEIDLGVFDRIRVRLGNVDLRPAWKEARKPLRQDQRDHVKRQEGPGGSWPQRASETSRRSGRRYLSRNASRTRITLRRRSKKLLGRLPGAVTTRMDRMRLAIISRAKWSGIHQEGGTAAHGARIPARPFLWASDRVVEEISKIVAKGLAYLIEVS